MAFRPLISGILVSLALSGAARALPPEGEAGTGRVLIVLPHPDDETLIRSTLTRLIEKGNEITLVVLTLGEGGKDWRWNDPRPSWELGSEERIARAKLLAETRRREMKNAADAYGVHRYYQFEVPDDPVRDPFTHKPTRDHTIFLKEDGPWKTAEIKSDLAKIADETKPDLVITFFPGQADSHAHHQATAQIVTELETEGRFGERLKGVYGFYEDHVVNGIRAGTLPGEIAGTRLEFSPKAVSWKPGKNRGKAYGEIGTAGALMHESQRSGYTGDFFVNWERNPNEILAPMGKQRELPPLLHAVDGVSGIETYWHGRAIFIPASVCEPNLFLKP